MIRIEYNAQTGELTEIEVEDIEMSEVEEPIEIKIERLNLIMSLFEIESNKNNFYFMLQSGYNAGFQTGFGAGTQGFNNAFVGIQPQLRQIPPRLSFSIIATFLPNCEALIAATYPPGPLPKIMMSYFIVWFIIVEKYLICKEIA